MQPTQIEHHGTARRYAAISLPLAAAAGAHLAAAPSHFREAALFGIFFLAVAGIQLAQAFVAGTTRSHRTLSLIAAFNAAVIGVWVVSRTTGVPFGPDAYHPESIGIIDTLSVFLELVVIGTSIAALKGARGPRISRSRAGSFLVVATVLLSTGLAQANPGRHGHHYGAGHTHRGYGTQAAAHLHGVHAAGEVDPGRDPLRTAKSPIDGIAIAVGKDPVAIASGGGSVWVANRMDGTVSRINAVDNQVTSTTVEGAPAGIAYGYRYVWVANYGTDRVQQIDPATGKLVGRGIHVGSGPVAIAAGPSGIWVATVAEGMVQRIDPKTHRAGKPVPVGYGPTGLAVDARGVWVANTLDHTMVRVDAKTLRASRPIPVPAGNVGIVEGFGKIWVASASAGVVTPINVKTMKAERPISVDNISFPGFGPTAVTIAAGRVWVANNHDKTIIGINPSTFQVGKVLFFDNRLATYIGAVQIVEQSGSLWVTDFDAGNVIRVMPSTVGEARP